ncbi:MAG: hypothetical protein WHT46_09790 [Candidatus Geothermincolales bacterium]
MSRIILKLSGEALAGPKHMGFDEETCRMKLISYHPGVTPELIQQFTGFELLIDENVHETPKPTEEELRILREEVDPNKLFCF